MHCPCLPNWNNIIMSVLFIGQNSPYYSPQLPSRITPHERRIRQEQYRTDLQRQIREKQERRLREQEWQEKYDRDYEAYLKGREPPTIFSTPPRVNPFEYPYNSRLQRSNTEPQQEISPLRLPTPKYRRKSVFTPSVFDLSLPRASRVRVEQYPRQRTAFDEFVESYQQRQKELREYQDRKMEEVYSKMYNSVDTISNQDQYELLKSRIKPLRLDLPQQPRTVANPQSANQYYRLPPIVKVTRSKSKSRKSKSRKEPEQGTLNWRQWYAREKLRELEEQYQKALIEDQTRTRDQIEGSRAETPKFAQRKHLKQRY